MIYRKPSDTTSTYLLKLIGAGLLLTVASILAPQLPYLLLCHLIRKKFGKNYSPKQIGNSVRYLKRKKFIAFEKKGHRFKLVLTKLGMQHQEKLFLSEIYISKSKWDGQWRVVTFDIPEEHKPARHIFRRKLKELGFFHFQRSVFILPFECEKEINLITDILKIRPYVHILRAQRFASDKALIKKINL